MTWVLCLSIKYMYNFKEMDQVLSTCKLIKGGKVKKCPRWKYKIGPMFLPLGTSLSKNLMIFYKSLRIFAALMAKEGYIATLQFVLHDIEENEKCDLLYGHSERLTMTFGLLESKPATAFQVMKHPHVSRDWYIMTKYISNFV